MDLTKEAMIMVVDPNERIGVRRAAWFHLKSQRGQPVRQSMAGHQRRNAATRIREEMEWPDGAA